MSPAFRPSGARPIYLAPFGLHARMMLGAYLRHTLMIAAALMTIALTIDLWPQVPMLAADPSQGGGIFFLFSLARLAVLRLPDLLPPFIPFATFLGVVWTESAFTESRERLLVWNSGRSPLYCMVPPLLMGAAMGLLLFTVDGLLRPAAIHVQIEEVLGREGKRLDRARSGGAHWIALPDGLLRAEIEYGPPVRLHNTTIYKLDTNGHLSEVDSAVEAVPLGGDRWRLRAGRAWTATAHSGTEVTLGDNSEEVEVPFGEKTITLSLNTLWLHNVGLSPQYLYLPDLYTLAHAEIFARDGSGYRTRFQALLGGPLLTCAMALLAAALSLRYFAYRTRAFALVAVLLTGYLSHFMVRALYLMGEFGYVPAPMAGWMPPLLILAMAVGVLLLIQRDRGLAWSLRDRPDVQADRPISR